jgi:alpha-L-fucosidase
MKQENTMSILKSNLSVPPYLSEYQMLYQQNPHQAALSWFADAGFGLFMHYGIYSLLGRHEWVMYREAIPLSQYEKLKEEFTAQNFDADFITDLALAAGMKYINITSRHHDSFCLFESRVSEYTSVNSPANRDLVAELAEKCQQKGLGLFLYYSYALDWWHPYFYPRSIFHIARPDYPFPEPRYKWKQDSDFKHYIDFVHAQVEELLTNYGPIAGIWFDPIMGYYARPDLFPIEKTYAMIHKLQPQTLIAFKQGANGQEDFASPERHGHSLADRVREQIGEASAIVAQNAWDRNKSKHNEICDTLQPGAWGYTRDDEGKHHTVEEVLQMLADAQNQNCNLLLNTGPLPDGSIHPDDVDTLRKVGVHFTNR